MAWDGVGQVKLAPWVPPKGLQKVEEEQGRKRRNEIKKGCVIMWEISLPLNCTSASKPRNSPTARTVIHQHHILSMKYSPGRKYWTSLISPTQAVEHSLENGPVYIDICVSTSSKAYGGVGVELHVVWRIHRFYTIPWWHFRVIRKQSRHIQTHHARNVLVKRQSLYDMT